MHKEYAKVEPLCTETKTEDNAMKKKSIALQSVTIESDIVTQKKRGPNKRQCRKNTVNIGNKDKEEKNNKGNHSTILSPGKSNEVEDVNGAESYV